jgi:hypothetical protein
MKIIISLLMVGFAGLTFAYDGFVQKEITADEIVEIINSNLKASSFSSSCTSDGKAVNSTNLTLEALIGSQAFSRFNSLNEAAGIYRSSYGLMVQINDYTLALTRANQGAGSSIVIRNMTLKYFKSNNTLFVQEVSTVNNRGEVQSIRTCSFKFNL